MGDAMPALSGVYEIVNTKTGMRYVGSSINMQQRRQQHMHDLRNGVHCNPYLQNSYNIHGEGEFQFNVIETAPKNSIREMEQSLIDESDFDSLYNIATKVSEYRTGKRKPQKTSKIVGYFPVFLSTETEEVIPFPDGIRLALKTANAGLGLFGEKMRIEDRIVFLSNVAFEAARIVMPKPYISKVEAVVLRPRCKKLDGRRGGPVSRFYVTAGWREEPSGGYPNNDEEGRLLKIYVLLEKPKSHVQYCIKNNLIFSPDDENIINEMQRMFVHLTKA
jgi:hypothetical protein